MAEYTKEKPSAELDERASKGLLATFGRHRTAPNILMLIMVMFGIWAATKIATQFFPEIARDRITISENWSGASSEDVDQAVIQVIEPAVRFIEGADEVFSSAQEGSAIIQIEYASGTNMTEANADAGTAVDALVGSLPEDANDPRIRKSAFRDFVSNIILSGPYERLALLEFAEEIREGLLNEGLLQVDIIGTYRPEIRIEPDPAELRRLDLTIGQLSGILSAQSQDTPAGDIAGGERLVRTLGQLADAEAYKNLTIKALPDGTKVYLSDIAKVQELNAASGVDSFRNGEPAIEISIKRGAGGDSLKQQRIVDAYIGNLRGSLPANLKVDIYNVRADVIKARLSLLVENGVIGLIIVLVLLFLFLNWRTAFWVAAGIPISLAATIGLMYFSGQSINMISLFALILTLGIIVDDAIVVGEHSDALYAVGFKPSTAAILGAQRMAGPVVSASLTTIIAFGAILVIGGRFGALLQAIPLAVVAVLVASLIECFLILPGHMRHSMAAQSNTNSISSVLDKLFSPIRRFVDWAFDAFRYKVFRPTVKVSLIFRYPIIAICIAGMMISVAAVSAKKIPFRFFVAPEFNSVNANISMLNGASREDTITQLGYM
ncbi:MAG: efflux RND transporter permease subunit [Alphaproteobacteria bacterium]